MFRRKPEPPPPPVPYWSAPGVSARWSMVPVGLRGKSRVPGVELVAGEVTARMRLDEVQDLVERRIGIVDGLTTPTAFLARVGGFARDSAAGEVTAGLPDGALVLLVAPMDAPPALVLEQPDAEAFEEWVRGLG